MKKANLHIAPTDSNLEELVEKKSLVELHFKYGVEIPFGVVRINKVGHESITFVCQEDNQTQCIWRDLIESIELLN